MVLVRLLVAGLVAVAVLAVVGKLRGGLILHLHLLTIVVEIVDIIIVVVYGRELIILEVAPGTAHLQIVIITIP